MQVDTPLNETCHRLVKDTTRAKTKVKARASISDTVKLILWLKAEQMRIVQEVKELNLQGYQTTALHNYWRILENQVRALEFEVIVEKSGNLSLE